MRHCFEYIKNHQSECLNKMYHNMKYTATSEEVQQFQMQFMDIKLLNFKQND